MSAHCQLAAMETISPTTMTATIGSPLSGTTWMARRGAAVGCAGGTPSAVMTAIAEPSSSQS
jgi:hypothetical protein